MTPLSPVRITAPTETPVSLDAVKEYLRETEADQDDTITAMIEAATTYLDGWSGVLGRCLVTQVWSQSFDDFPAGDDLQLPFPDVSSVTVTYYDDAGASQTLSSGAYRLVRDARGAKIALDDDQSWPATDDRPDAVTVQMTCGYGAATAVPPILRHAIKVLAAAMYEGREGQMTGSPAFDHWISPFRHTKL